MILVLGGTTEGRKICHALIKEKVSFSYTVTSEYQKKTLTTETPYQKIIVRTFDRQTLSEFIRSHKIKVIIDATHPFAVDISKTAMTVSRENNIRYLRYERKNTRVTESKYIHYFASYDEMKDDLSAARGNILVTTGMKSIAFFAREFGHRLEDLFFRILPVSSSLLEAERYNITPSHIIAMQGPFDEQFNDYLLKKFSIKICICKESGREGGFEEKIKTCLKNKVSLLVLKKPDLNYPEVCRNVSEMFNFIESLSGLTKNSI